MSARNFALISGTWKTTYNLSYVLDDGNNNNSSIYEWDLDNNSGIYEFTGATHSLEFVPGTTSTNGTWIVNPSHWQLGTAAAAAAALSRNGHIITLTTQGINRGTWDERDAFVNSVVPTSGPTVTQTRTTHTGIIPQAAGFIIRNPSPGSFYEKTGVGKFKVKFLDQNEPGSYNLRVTWTTLTGTISDTQTISQGSGDIELEYTGTAPSNTPVYGPITLQIDQVITINNQQHVANTDFETFTYYETGPYTASFSPDLGLPGQAIGYSITDTNLYPDNDSTAIITHPNGSTGSATLSSGNNYSVSAGSVFAAQHGTYTITINNTVIATAIFDSNYVAPTTTSNGGGRPDRYPLIMTNLFNRNRSIYSIGMTHKDTWDLFL